VTNFWNGIELRIHTANGDEANTTEAVYRSRRETEFERDGKKINSLLM
jgi:hypothetical protein